MSPITRSAYARLPKPNVLIGFVSKHIVTFNIASLALVMCLFVGYVAQVNNAVAKGYQMRELETRIHDLTMENRQLEVVAREAQSLENVASSITMMGLVKAENPVYVEASEPAYALAD